MIGASVVAKLDLPCLLFPGMSSVFGPLFPSLCGDGVPEENEPNKTRKRRGRDAVM